jgi:hypothetical protein
MAKKKKKDFLDRYIEKREANIWNGKNNLIIVSSRYFDVVNGNGYPSQPLSDFIQGKKSLPLALNAFGCDLFDIMFDEGIIRFEENKFFLTNIINYKIKSSNYLENDAMTLLGKIAEAIVVRNCRRDSKINREWLSVATSFNRRVNIEKAEKYTAIGTGLKYTKESHFHHYNPSDPQRDVIWVDKEDKPAIFSKIVVGLQLKASTNGKNAVLHSLKYDEYVVPLVYFDMKDDYNSIVYEYKKFLMDNGKDELIPIIHKKFIRGREIDFNAHIELDHYKELVVALANNKITPEQLINHKDLTNDTVLKDAFMSTAMQTLHIPHAIEFKQSSY